MDLLNGANAGAWRASNETGGLHKHRNRTHPTHSYVLFLFRYGRKSVGAQPTGGQICHNGLVCVRRRFCMMLSPRRSDSLRVRWIFYLSSVLLHPTWAVAQTTNCTTYGNNTTCQTQQPTSNAPIDYLRALGPLPSAGGASATAPIEAVDAASARRIAYAQVGQLIAEGKCVEAKRLARFYGRDQIVADTDRACP